MTGVVTIASPSWEVAESYGRYALEVKRVLEARGWTVNTVGCDMPNKVFVPTLLNILMAYPTHFHQYGRFVNSGIRFALTTWESTELPKGWSDILNDFAGIFVPCSWNMDVFAENGVTAPLYQMPHGMSGDFHYEPRQNRRKFRFLVIGDRNDRKRGDKAFFAFIKAFGDRSDVELVVKSRRPTRENANKNVTYVTGEYSDAQMQELYASCDCMIFPSSAEGFGFPPREFALTGGLPIVTNYSGLTDDLPRWGIPLDYQLESAWEQEPQYRGLGQWASADVDRLAEMLVAVRNMPFPLRQALGKAFSENVAALYRWDNVGDLLDRKLKEAVDGYRKSA